MLYTTLIHDSVDAVIHDDTQICVPDLALSIESKLHLSFMSSPPSRIEIVSDESLTPKAMADNCVTVNVQGKLISLSKLGSKAVLPLELANEPVTNDDNGYRPELVVGRAKFLFWVNGGGIETQARGIVQSHDLSFGTTFKKNKSKVSILSVYDTYGFDVACSFLVHLFEQCKTAMSVTKLYILASANAMNLLMPVDTSVVDILSHRVRTVETGREACQDSLQSASPDAVPSRAGRRDDAELACIEDSLSAHPQEASCGTAITRASSRMVQRSKLSQSREQV